MAEHLRSETVLQVVGKVRARPAESINERLATGQIEVLASASSRNTRYPRRGLDAPTVQNRF